MITIIGLIDFPLINKGDDLGRIIVETARKQDIIIEENDVIVVSQKIVSKAEGLTVNLKEVNPSELAKHIAAQTNRDPRHVEIILRESNTIVKMKNNHLIVETKHGFICANAGVDKSNVEGEEVISVLPLDSDKSASRIRHRILRITKKNPAVIITDTWGRPWRLGQVDFAIGVSGMNPFRNYRGERDMFGYMLRVTNIAVADELASAAELVKGKSKGVPVAIIRGFDFIKGRGKAKKMIRPQKDDLFR